MSDRRSAMPDFGRDAIDNRAMVDPELVPLIDLLVLGPLSDDRITEVRSALTARRPLLDTTEGTSLEQSAPGADGAPDVPLLIYGRTPEGPPRPALLHIHGGGYVMGAAYMTDEPNRAMSEALGCVIVSVDYRLAPESPFPAALDDCYAALSWLHRNSAALNVDSSRIALIGESAGGGLAATLAQLARDKGEIPIAFQLLSMPMLDDRTGRDDSHGMTGAFVWTAADNRYGWDSYLRAYGAARPPYAAAARMVDLSGLPPCFIAVGALDLFLREDLLYAARLAEAGVPVEVHVYPGAVHAFQLVPGTRLSREFDRAQVDALRRALAIADPVPG